MTSYNEKEIGTFKGWRIFCVTDNNSANLYYSAIFDFGGQNMPKMKTSKNLEELKNSLTDLRIRRKSYARY